MGTVFIMLVLLECLLRLTDAIYIYKKPSLYRDNKKNVNHSKIKILAIDESTTGGLWIENRSCPIQFKRE